MSSSESEPISSLLPDKEFRNLQFQYTLSVFYSSRPKIPGKVFESLPNVPPRHVLRAATQKAAFAALVCVAGRLGLEPFDSITLLDRMAI
jgi:hypothetical protein